LSNLILEKEKMLLPSTIHEYEKMKLIEEYKTLRKQLPLIKTLKKKFKHENDFRREKAKRNIKLINVEYASRIEQQLSNLLGRKI
jgi:hypothetical protein